MTLWKQTRSIKASCNEISKLPRTQTKKTKMPTIVTTTARQLHMHYPNTAPRKIIKCEHMRKSYSQTFQSLFQQLELTVVHIVNTYSNKCTKCEQIAKLNPNTVRNDTTTALHLRNTVTNSFKHRIRNMSSECRY